uniref:Cadherin domain-containing protein n=1 Tax=Timema cristinae TaxID=61476 RepID=A0A7R9GP59_TIMCR|nr:unnamed protein product [Timema cristinae]
MKPRSGVWAVTIDFLKEAAKYLFAQWQQCLRSSVRYSIYSGDPEDLFSIDLISGNLRTASLLDHETRQSVLLNVLATSGDPPSYGHTQVIIVIEDVNDNGPEFDSSSVRISVPENAELGIPLYAAHARDKDSGRNGAVRYKLSSSPGTEGLFVIDPRQGHITLSRPLDYETTQRHSLVLTASDSGDPPRSANLTVLVEVQDVNDNPPVFERMEYAISVLESLPVNSQLANAFVVLSSISEDREIEVRISVIQVTAVDLDTGNNARLTYRLFPSNNLTVALTSRDDEKNQEVFGVFPNSGWLYLRRALDREVGGVLAYTNLRRALDRESRDRYIVRVVASDNGSPSGSATARVVVTVLDANDNDPKFSQESYEFWVEENRVRGTTVGQVKATDPDLESNGALRYSIIPSNSSFQINPNTGEISTHTPLDRELRPQHELVVEARDQGSPQRSSRVAVRIKVSDVNDNAPDLVDPREDVVSVREEQPPGTEVVRVRAVDRDLGENASVKYSLLKGRDSDGHGVFTVDALSGVVRTTTVLDHEDRAIYRLAVAATDGGDPPQQTVRLLRVEVLDLNDNRPTFTSSSLVFRVREDVRVGHVVGTVATSDPDHSNHVAGGQVTYTLTSVNSSEEEGAEPEDNSVLSAFDMDRTTGSLVVARELDRETRSVYRLEVRALDTSASNNPQSSAVSVRVEVADVNDNPPRWLQDPITLPVSEDALIGSPVWNFSATDADFGPNGEVRYMLVKQWPDAGEVFTVDPLTGTLTLRDRLDYESTKEYHLVIRAMDQAVNESERLSTTVTTRVLVRDSNDNPPVFLSPSTPVVHVGEDTLVGYPLCHVIASDRDSGENGRVTYDITGGNDEGWFVLDRSTGVLTLARSLGNGGTYVLNVTASDHGAPVPQRASKAIRIVVQGAKDNPPRKDVLSLSLSPLSIVLGSINLSYLRDSFVINLLKVFFWGGGVCLPHGEMGVGGGNLTYSVPPGAAEDRFTVDARSGVVSVRAPLDREARDRYALPVYVSNGAHAHGDLATVWVRVTDVNDNPPVFRPGACYPLAVPENSDLAVIHTVVAVDKDIEGNGEITYTIAGGNIGNRFSLDPHTGELKSRPLDRESLTRYWLLVMAQDRGSPAPLRASCNISVLVEDQNDNDPVFAQPRYLASVAEDAPPGTAVLTVHATDADLGPNARLVYSLANESDWMPLDHERQSSYSFQVVAMDGGRYDARSQRVPVQVTVTDVNDNKPVFTKFPFTARVPAYTQPGHTLVRVTAEDADEGTNSEVVFSLVNEPLGGKFRINPNTGAISAASSLTPESGRLFRLQVLARDKGNPPQSSTGLVEVRVGEGLEGATQLRFQNNSYHVDILENSPPGTEVIQVSAVRTDGRRQRISYSLGSGNEDSIFDVDPGSGMVQVRDSRGLDYEQSRELRLSVVAETEGPLFGYCEVVVHLQDYNDNPPYFTQPQYSAAVWEGNNKGTFVMQVTATDADETSNSQVLYHIVDGNHDNAFVIEPPFSGLVKTNIVLDREIRDTYKLTVIATDEGVPQLTGTSTLRISIVDVNDNPPTFPPHSVISVSEGTEVGAVLTAVTANDVDSNPALTYHFSSPGEAPDDPAEPSEEEEGGSPPTFSIDRFSGKVTLVRGLDFESRREHRLRVTASDTAHAAHTVLTVRVTDENDNRPQFGRSAYLASLPPEGSDPSRAILTLNASDADSGDNGRVRFSLLPPAPRGFLVDPTTGALYANRSGVRGGDAQFAVVATDLGRPELTDVVAVRVRVGEGSGLAPRFIQHDYRVRIREDSPRGTTMIRIATADQFSEESQGVMFHIVDGDHAGAFQVLSPSGELMLLKMLDRETEDFYTLRVTAGDHNSSGVVVRVTVEDANDNPPLFQGGGSYIVSVSEGANIGHNVLRLLATDADLLGNSNSEVHYDIASGNDEDLFSLDSRSGVVSVNKGLDFDSGDTVYILVIRASDNAKPPDSPLSTIATVQIRLEDENDNTPVFPVTEYVQSVPENEPAGTAVFATRATDADRGPYGTLNYSMVVSPGLDDSWKLFRVDAVSGIISTMAAFDYEQRSRYTFSLRARDIGGKEAIVRVRIEIEGRDEFHPQFTERTYRFALASIHMPVGRILGHVYATDRDKGTDGRVVYQMTTQHPYFKVNRTTGAVVLKKKLDDLFSGTSEDISFVVTASSGRQGSLTNMTVVEITLDPLSTTKGGGSGNELGDTAFTTAGPGGLADWAMGLLVTLVLIVLALGAIFLFLHVRNRRHKKSNKPALTTGGVADGFVDPSAFDTIPIRGSTRDGGRVQGVPPNSQFGPPKYDEIPPYPPVHRNNNNNSGSPNSGAATTSELSGSEQSGSSGRGSAEEGEDVEDEEIRMINEGGPLKGSAAVRDGGGIDDDNLSNVSVRNTQEYLARLGIVVVDNPTATSGPPPPPPPPLDGLHMFGEEGAGEAEIANLIYAKLNDAGGGSAGGSEDGGGTALEHAMALSGFGDVPSHHQPSMTGSLSSIVHSEEELTGSYNWDYLLDWGPQYQPLAHVFSEIARLKDDAASVHSANSASSSGKGKLPAPQVPLPHPKTLPPPLLTSVAPRLLAAPRTGIISSSASSSVSASHRSANLLALPRSPISHDATGQGFSTSAAMSPSFSPSLSPLATRSPSISPLVPPGVALPRHGPQIQRTDPTELRI